MMKPKSHNVDATISNMQPTLYIASTVSVITAYLKLDSVLPVCQLIIGKVASFGRFDDVTHIDHE